MTDKKRGLGRGLGALIPTSPGPSVVTEALLTPSDGAPTHTRNKSDLRIERHEPDMDGLAHYAEIPLSSITPNPRQPRQVFEEESLAELVYSMREVGLLQPIVVRPVAADHYELVAGERR